MYLSFTAADETSFRVIGCVLVLMYAMCWNREQCSLSWSGKTICCQPSQKLHEDGQYKVLLRKNNNKKFHNSNFFNGANIQMLAALRSIHIFTLLNVKVTTDCSVNSSWMWRNVNNSSADDIIWQRHCFNFLSLFSNKAAPNFQDSHLHQGLFNCIWLLCLGHTINKCTGGFKIKLCWPNPVSNPFNLSFLLIKEQCFSNSYKD